MEPSIPIPRFGPVPVEIAPPPSSQSNPYSILALHSHAASGHRAPPVIPPPPMPLKRKKWTEEEERSLIDKYAEMQSDGTLVRMRTREKKFRPIAAHVNAAHHAAASSSYPFLWTWKDASTKVQNMRHQYLLVKQKLLSTFPSDSDSSSPDWSNAALSLWPNFLRYRNVFGDAPLKPNPEEPNHTSSFTADADLDLGLQFDCCGGGDDDEDFDYQDVPPVPPPPPPLPAPTQPQKKRKKRPERRAWARLAVELARLRDREVRLEEWDRERQAEGEERARREAEEGERQQREWEERMERRRVEWRERMEGMLNQHRAEMENMHARILHDQQSVASQLLGVFSNWPGAGMGAGLSDGAGIGNHHHHNHHHHPYLVQMMNGMVPGENRVGGDGQEDQFIVDG